MSLLVGCILGALGPGVGEGAAGSPGFEQAWQEPPSADTIKVSEILFLLTLAKYLW